MAARAAFERIFSAWEVSSDEWMAHHEASERLSARSHLAVQAGQSDELVDRALTDKQLLRNLVADVLVCETWRERLLPDIAKYLLAEPPKSSSAAWLRIYFGLFHETSVANLLQLLLYHESVASTLGSSDCLVDLIDYAVRRVTALASASHVRNSLRQEDRAKVVTGRLRRLAAEASQAAGLPRSSTEHQAAVAALPPAQLLRAAAGAPPGCDPELQLALVLAQRIARGTGNEQGQSDSDAGASAVLALLPRLMDLHGPGGADPPLLAPTAPSASPNDDAQGAGEAADPEVAACIRVAQWAADSRFRGGLACVSALRYLSEHVAALPLGGVSRLLDTHDLMLAVVPLIENPPTIMRVQGQGGGKPSWRKFVGDAWAEVAPGELLRLTPHEAAPWLVLFHLTSDPGCRSRYALHSHRKGTLLRARKYLTPVLLEQVPPLSGLQRYLDELSLMAVPEPAQVAQGGLLLQALPEVQQAVVRAALGTTPAGWTRGAEGGGGHGGGNAETSGDPPGAAPADSPQPSQPIDLPSTTTAAPSPAPQTRTSSALLELEAAPSVADEPTGTTAAMIGAAGKAGVGGRLASLLRVLPEGDQREGADHARPAPSTSSSARGKSGEAHAAAVERGGPRWSWREAAQWCAGRLREPLPAGLTMALATANASVSAASGAPASLTSGGRSGALGLGVGSGAAAPGLPAGEADDSDEALLAALGAGPAKCERCGASGPSVQRCSRCRNAYYCGRQCQQACWPSHQPLCDVVARNRPASAATTSTTAAAALAAAAGVMISTAAGTGTGRTTLVEFE